MLFPDALSACALYASKNTANGPVVMRCIDAKVKDLLRSGMTLDFFHALARTQAMILYQIMRFFDGDIIARSSAETTFSELDSSAYVLASYITWDTQKNPGRPDLNDKEHDASPLDLQTIHSSWRDWVLQESARRTYLVARFFSHVWKLLTGRRVGACSRGPPPAHESWTLSSHLWQARDAFDFAVAWRDRSHYVVKRKAILSTLADAGGDDIEVFGKMLLTVSLGVDQAKAYLALKGSSL